MQRASLRRRSRSRNQLTNAAYELFVLGRIAAQIGLLRAKIAAIDFALLFRGRPWLQLFVLCVIMGCLSFFVSRMALTSN
jgi:hypothetical protein